MGLQRSFGRLMMIMMILEMVLGSKWGSAMRRI
jgi:hypothetical protein